MKLFNLLLLLSSVSILNAQSAIDSIKIEFITWENHEYAFVRHIKPNMVDAQCECSKLGMELVKIETKAENRFLQNWTCNKKVYN